MRIYSIFHFVIDLYGVRVDEASGKYGNIIEVYGGRFIVVTTYVGVGTPVSQPF